MLLLWSLTACLDDAAAPPAPPAVCTTDVAPPARDPLVQCVTSWTCDSERAASARSFDECEGSWTVYLGPRGAVVSGVRANDTQTCDDNTYAEWWGEPVDDCPQLDPLQSPGCASPAPNDQPPVVITAGRPSGPNLATWTAEAGCHGAQPCPLPDGVDGLLTYTYTRCGFGSFRAWSPDGAPLGESTHQVGFAELQLPGASEETRAAVEACVAAPAFTASGGCGVAR